MKSKKQYFVSLFTGITNNSGVATCNLNYLVNGTVTASYSNVSAIASVVSNYQPPSVTLTEPISYTVVDNTTNGTFDVYLYPCEYVGASVTLISELYNPPMTNDELFDSWINEFRDGDYTFNFVNGELVVEGVGDMIAYAIATEDYANWLTINYSTTTGSDITITVSD